jgi:hypothetical protein
MNSNSFNLLCDDLYLDMFVNTELELPSERDTVLSFFERVRKQYPSMGCFYKRENNEFCLEEDRERSQYRWVSLESDRIGSGIVNPTQFEMAYEQDRLILELMPYMLSVSPLDIDSLDVTFAMDFDCTGNHDEVIAEALLSQSAFSCVLDLPGIRPIGVSPTIVVALTSDEIENRRLRPEEKRAGHRRSYKPVVYGAPVPGHNREIRCCKIFQSSMPDCRRDYGRKNNPRYRDAFDRDDCTKTIDITL